MTGNNIPTELKEKQQWVCHDAAKVPFQPNGSTAKTNDPATGSSFQDVCKAVQKNKSSKRFTGIGFVFTDADEYAGIDIDCCLNNGQLKQVARLYTSYLVSPHCRHRKWTNSLQTPKRNL